ncbi:MAG: 16S rRNA (uracil(1498)-N(3))-methyltransferase [Oscillatoriales cyanobacterium]|nr:MAG: 16S rRNA (uracil(1498)-N(3))-methyltransferase [Oscillatoriales cyanobacterium]
MAQLQRLAVTAAQICANKIDLTKEQQHYLNRVLRLQAGDRFIAMDGCGHWWSAILEVQETGLFASITEEIAVNRELPVAVTLMAALPKGNAFDEVVRQATELGVANIVPVTSDRTLLKPSPQKVDRWRRIAAEAAEQSERQIVPAVCEPVSFDLAVKDCRQKHRFICVARGDNRYLWDCLSGLEPPQPPLLRGGQEPEESHGLAGLEPPFVGAGTGAPPLQRGEQEPEELSTVISRFDPPQPPLRRGEEELESIAIAVGPEGGWTDGEVERAIEFGFEPVSLGRRILRAVTAPINESLGIKLKC